MKSRIGGVYGESALSGNNVIQEDDTIHQEAGDDINEVDGEPVSRTRMRGLGQLPTARQQRKHIEGYNALDELEDESDASSSGGEWDGGEDDEVEDNIIDEEEDDDADMSRSEASADEEDISGQQSLVVSLRYQKKQKPSGVEDVHQEGDTKFDRIRNADAETLKHERIYNSVEASIKEAVPNHAVPRTDALLASVTTIPQPEIHHSQQLLGGVPSATFQRVAYAQSHT